MKAVIISAAAVALLSFPAWAQQGWPARNDCESIVRDLELRPPSYGDPSRVNYVWESYLANCEHLPWTKMIGADDINEVAKVLHPKMYK